MTTEQGLLRTSLRFAWNALNENGLLRASVLGTILCITLFSIALAAFGVTYTLGAKGGPQAYSPRLFALLFLPAEFLIYDLILGNPAPRAALKDLYLDLRFLWLLWTLALLYLGLALPVVAAGFVNAFLVGFLKTRSGGAFLGIGLLVVCDLILAVALAGLVVRFFYLPVIVSQRGPKPLATTYRETKGKAWRISCALFLPYLAIFAVSLPMELLGPVLERNLGFVGLAPWFLLDALMTGFFCCVSAAVLAFSYQRAVRGTDPGETATA
ncbi:MAG: hypothetical protein P4L39_06000 [Humidesulfovibrio sp.]|nr:hypothetical protein [Humidesulfovibrio sp.]